MNPGCPLIHLSGFILWGSLRRWNCAEGGGRNPWNSIHCFVFPCVKTLELQGPPTSSPPPPCVGGRPPSPRRQPPLLRVWPPPLTRTRSGEAAGCFAPACLARFFKELATHPASFFKFCQYVVCEGRLDMERITTHKPESGLRPCVAATPEPASLRAYFSAIPTHVPKFSSIA